LRNEDEKPILGRKGERVWDTRTAEESIAEGALNRQNSKKVNRKESEVMNGDMPAILKIQEKRGIFAIEVQIRRA